MVLLLLTLYKLKCKHENKNNTIAHRRQRGESLPSSLYLETDVMHKQQLEMKWDFESMKHN